MSKCKSCSKSAGVYGVDDIPYTTIGAAIASALVTAKLDIAVTENADGTPKDNFLAKSPTMKNALYLIGGALLTSMDGEMYQGAGVGMATYGGFNLVQGLMEQYSTPTGVGSLQFIPPSSIGKLPGQYTIPGNAGTAPSILGLNKRQGVNINELSKSKQVQKMPVLRR